MVFGAPIFFSIIVLSIREPRIDQQEYSYSVDIQIDTTCPSKKAFYITLHFVPSDQERKNCLLPFEHNITCKDLTYGVHYDIDGYLQCGKNYVNLSPTTPLYVITTPKYINSTSSPTSIDTRFFLPGLFHRLIIEIKSVNQTCSIQHSSLTSPFYNCLFRNLPSAQSFNLTYYLLRENNQSLHANATIVYTELEELNFSCQLNETNQQIAFHWSNFTSSGYTNLTISLSTGNNKTSWMITFDPYLSQGICSTKQYQLKPGTKYKITAKLTKVLTNYNGEKLDRCSIKTNLSPIPVDSIRDEFVNETTVRLNWLKHPFSVQARLINLETNFSSSPTEYNETSALFINLAEASIYEVEFHISKENYSSIIQMADYFIKTNFKNSILKNIVRLSENSLLVNINQYNSQKIEIIYCIKQIIGNKLQNCSNSNLFTQLSSGTIYNVSVNIRRNSFKSRFFWNETLFKLVNTNFSPLDIRFWKSNDNCGVKLLNTFSSECSSNETTYNCDELRCGCEYQLNITFNKTMINSLCSSSPCDIQLNDSNFTNTKIQTPLETIKNLRIVNVSSVSRQIEVKFDNLSGCFDRWILICESLSSKQRRNFSNSTICTELIPDESYRIHVEIERTGWDTVPSNSLEIKLSSTSNPNQGKKRTIVIFNVIGILILIGLTVSLFVYRGRQREQSSQQSTTINNEIPNTNLNIIVNHVNVYLSSKQMDPIDSEKNVLISRPIRIQNLLDEYEKLVANDYYHISDEFEKLGNNLQEILPSTQSDQLFQNRYKDIIPYEHTRVELIPIDEYDSGYINASFINGLHNPHEYIACQGPLQTTINDHWKMIWEQNITIIVMLSSIIERGVNKCEQYWPVELNETEMFGDISVCVTEYVNLTAYDLRCIQIKENDEIRSLKHYAFKMWDDHKVPTNGDELISFIRLIRSEYRPEHDGPILVHCSAGIDRSGTFIALDRLLQQFDKLPYNGYLDIYGTVLDMRRCRNKMVQTKDQYLFIYQCLKEEYEKTSGKWNYDDIFADDSV